MKKFYGKKFLSVPLFTLVLLSMVFGTAFAGPSGKSYFNTISVGIGEAEIEFVQTPNYWGCFEYRSDGDTSQILSENSGNNYNTAITDGLYPYVCLNGDSRTKVLNAVEYVEIRMVFGAEGDDRFDWIRVDVLSAGQSKVCNTTGFSTVTLQGNHICTWTVPNEYFVDGPVKFSQLPYAAQDQIRAGECDLAAIEGIRSDIVWVGTGQISMEKDKKCHME
jgi:hypothetical protein